jgi:ribonuclease-3
MTALTPASANKQNNYELLEFVGDGVLRFIIPELLLERYAKSRKSHGEVARMYSSITSNVNLALMAMRLKLYPYIRFRSGKVDAHIARSGKLHADIVEAIFGAIERDAGIFAAMNVARNLFQMDLEIARFEHPQEILLRETQQQRVSYSAYPRRDVGFAVVLKINSEVIIDNGLGYNIETASRNAAALALLKLFPKRYPCKIKSMSWDIPKHRNLKVSSERHTDKARKRPIPDNKD